MQRDAWLREVKRSAERVVQLDPRMAASDLERMAITEAAIILQLLAEIERLAPLASQTTSRTASKEAY